MLRKILVHIFYLFVMAVISSCGESHEELTASAGANLIFSGNIGLPAGQFDRTLINRTTTLRVFVTNFGNSIATDINYNLGASSVISYTGGAFPGGSGTCTNTLSAGTSCFLEFDFSPIDGTVATSTLDVEFEHEFNSVVNTLTVDLIGQGFNPALLAFDITSHDFGPVAHDPLGGSGVENVTLTISNNGEWDATDLNFIAPGSPYSVATNNCTNPIEFGDSCTVDLEFSPTAVGAFNYNPVGPNPADTYRFRVDYNNGLAAPTVTNDFIISTFEGEGTGVALLALTASPDAFDFDEQIVGGSYTGTFTLTNTGGAIAVIDEALTNNLTAPFSFEGGTYPGVGGTCTNTNAGGDFILNPSEICTIVINFSPASVGLFNDDVEIAYHNGASGQVESQTIDGEGIAAGALEISEDPLLDFGALHRNEVAYATLTITNTGATPVSSMDDISLAAPYSYEGGFPGTDGTTPGTCTASLAGFNNSCTIVVRFEPTSYGTFTDEIQVDYFDGAVTNSVLRDVTGEALQPEVEILVPVANGYINIANVNAFTVSGTCTEAGQTVDLDVGGITQSPVCSGTNTFTVDFDLTSLTDGPYTITADHADTFLNTATQYTVDVEKDIIAPSSTSLTIASNNVNDTESAVPGDIVTITIDANEALSALPIVTIDGNTATVTGTGPYDATYAMATGDTEGVIAFTVDLVDEAGNPSVTEIATTDSSSVNFDETLPTLTSVIISSDNVDPTFAKVGDTITLDIIADEELDSAPIVAIAGQLATVTGTGPSYAATYVMTASDPEGVIGFTINLTDQAGNVGVQVTTPSDPLNIVTFDRDLPIATPVSLSSNNADPAIAFVGDEVTLSFTVSETTNALPVVTIAGQSALVANTVGLAYEATYTMTSSDTPGPIAFTLDFADLAGNAAITITGTNDSSAVTFILGELTYASAAFDEAVVNDGSTTSSAVITLVGDVFTGLNGDDFVTDSKVTINNIPAGFVAVMNRDGDNQVTLTLTGNALSHEAIDSISNLEVIFLDSAFTNSPALTVTNFTRSDLTVDFLDTAFITYASDIFTEAPADDGSITASIVITLANEIFTGANGDDFVASSKVTMTNVPIGLAAVVTRDSDTQVSLTLTGNATDHDFDDDITDLTIEFEDTAFTNVVAANVVDFSKNDIEIDFIDTTAPLVEITSPVDADFINVANDSATFSVSGTCNEVGLTVNLEVNGASAPSQVGFNCDGTNFSGTFDSTGFATGSSLALVANLDDNAGNIGSSTTINLTKDTLVPTLTISIAADVTSANVGSYSVSGTCSEDGDIDLSFGSISTTTTCSGGAWNVTALDVTAEPDAPAVTISVDITDLAGNPATTPVTTTVIKDATDPIVTISTALDIISSNENIYSIIGACSENGVTVDVLIGALSFSPICSGGSFSTGTVNVSSLADGPITILAEQEDLVGNTGSNSVIVDKNTTTPTVTITSAPDIDQSNQTSYEVTGGCSDNGSNVIVNVGSLNITTSCSSGIWSTNTINVSSEPDGTIAITADHVTATQATATANKNTSLPVVTITSALNITSANELSYVVSGTCSEAGEPVDVNIGAVLVNLTCSGSNGWSTGFQDVSGESDGPVLITADHQDAVPVSAVQATITVSKATSEPTVSALSVPLTYPDSVDLSWTLDDPGGFTINDYIINFRIQGTTTWLVFDDGINVSTSTTVTGLVASTTYEFRVAVVYDTVNQSDFSNTAEGTTQPDSPIFGPNTAMNVGGATSSIVAAYEANTVVTLNGGALVTLANAGDTHLFTSSSFDVIDADKPIFTAGRRGTGSGATSGNIVWQPTSWAGKTFNFNAIREVTQFLHVYAIEDASIEVRQGGTVLASATVVKDGSTTLTWTPHGSYQVVSTGSILAYHISGSATRVVDSKPLPPSAFEVIGFPSQSMRLTSDFDSTNYSGIHSNSAVESGSLSTSGVVVINPEGTASLYQSESLLITADRKIGGASFADGNGSAAAPFMPTNLMKNKYILPTEIDYIAFASTSVGTIQVFNENQVLQATLTLTRSGANSNAPYRARTTTGGAGYTYIATTPVAAWYQPNTNTGASSNDETIMYGTD